ncbi:MAG: TIGR04086 family membrane protein [Clostridia bacterium]|nr:TIGR04086 family membrane protein [Clostridia bacterium]
MKEEKFLLSYIKGVVSSFTISIILFYILGIILTSSKITEKIITPAILIITGLSILIATSVVMIKNNEKGLLKGGLIGLSYFSILYIVSSISMQNFEINVYSMIMLVITFICGSIGGIVGINIKSYKK